MTFAEREAIYKHYENLDKELYDSNTHIITTYIDIIQDDGNQIPVLSAIYNPEDGVKDVVLGRTVTNRVTSKVHHLSIFEEFEKSYLIAYPLGESIDIHFSCNDFFENKVVTLRADSRVYFATNYTNNGIFHSMCSGYTTYRVKLFHITTTVVEDANIFKSAGTTRNYAICAIKEIVDRQGGPNASYGVSNIKGFFYDIDKNLARIDTTRKNPIPYPDDITISTLMIQNMLKNRVVKAIDVIKLKNLPTIGKEYDIDENELSINVKYLDPNMPKIEIIDKGDWIDLCTVEDSSLRKGDFRLIPLGVIIQLPEGYEALILPRSSTFKKWGILLANSMGVIDNSYRGPEDQWFFAAFATKDTVIPKYTRIAQFRLFKNQPKINLNEITEITGKSRGGFGSTGN